MDDAARVGAIIRGLRGDCVTSMDDAHTNEWDAAQREAALLEWLVTTYTAQRSFSAPATAGSPSAEDFRELVSTLVVGRFAKDDWWNMAPEANRLLVLQSLRLLMRDAALQEQWASEPGATTSFAARLHYYAAGYGASASSEFNLEIVGELAAMAKRLVRTHPRTAPSLTHISAHDLTPGIDCVQPVREPSVSRLLAELDVAGALVSLLRSSDSGLLHSVVVSLTRLAIDDGNRRTICELDPIDPLLAHLRDGEHNLRMAAAELLLLLVRERRTRDDIRAANGAALFLSLVSSDVRDVTLAALHLLCGLAREPEAGRDIRLLGGIPLLVGHLVRCITNSPAAGIGSDAAKQQSDDAGSDEIAEVLCVLLAKLALEDESAYQLRQANAVHALACLALKRATRISESSASSVVLRLQALCFRALRTLYTCVRNRRMFDRLLPGTLLVSFSEVPLCAENYLMAEFADGTAGSGVSSAELQPFKTFAQRFNDAMASSTQRAAVEAALHDIDAHASARRTIGDYDVLEVLGNGAFGTVYKVKHRRLGRMYAMKQLAQGLRGGVQWASTPRRPQTGGRPRTAARIEESQAAAMAQEVAILSQLEHPHIVHYYEQVRCDDDESLAIVMEYVEGASLRERISVALETRTPIPEEETWRILLQITLALRYLHVEMRVIHRDLTPGNVLLQHVPPTTTVKVGDAGSGGESLRNPAASFIVKLADFGLATVLDSSDQRAGGAKGEDGAPRGIGKGQSVVGTMLYACPEIVQSLPYTENADVWSLGCILYELASLQAPFAATSLLHVVKRIVECEYEPLLIRGEQSEEDIAALAAADEAAFQARLEAASDVSGMSAQVPPPRCLCSSEIADVVAALLVVDPELRPTMPRVAELLAPRLMAELERVSTTQRILLEEVRATGEERQRAILEGAIGREARAALRTRARTATATTAANLGAATSNAADTHRSARMGRLLQEQGRSSSVRGGGSAGGDVISIPAAALREISDPATELLGTFQQILRVAELPPMTSRERDDKVRRRVIAVWKSYTERYVRTPAGQYKTFLLENRVSVLKAELTKLTTGSSDLIPSAAELSPPKSYAEMLSTLKDLTEDLTFYDAVSSDGLETLLMTPTATESPLPTVHSDQSSD